MSVYVDEPLRIDGKFANYSHLWADSEAELDWFVHQANAACRAGVWLNKAWKQTKNPHFVHYDVSPRKRAEALRMGAVDKSLREWIAEQRAKEGKR